METTQNEARAAAAPAKVYTYHCICTNLVLASTTPMEQLPERTVDNSYICALPQASLSEVHIGHYAVSLSIISDRPPIVVRLEDGFEKRYQQRCGRCDLAIGYQLDKSQYGETAKENGRREDLVYLLLGGLSSTKDMEQRKEMSKKVVVDGFAAG